MEMKAYNLEEPQFEISEQWFTIIFKRPQLQKLSKELGGKLGENREKILELMQSDKFISIPKIAEKIGLSTTAVENNIAKLKEKGIIKRIGSAKSGH